MVRRTVVALVFMVVAASPATAQFSDAQLVAGWYRQYLKREPSPAEIGPWVQQIRQTGNPDIVQAMILGSDEYFARHDRKIDRFLTGLHIDLTGREPNSGEFKYWRNVYDKDRGQRQDVAFKFIVQLKQSGQPPAPNPAPLPGDLPSRMTQLSRSLTENARIELAGTVQGRNLLLRAHTLMQMAERYEQLVRQGSPAFGLASTLRNVEVAQGAVLQTLNNPAGSAPNCSRIAWEIGRTLEEIRTGTNWVPGPAPNPGYDTVAVAGFAADAARNGGLLATQIRLNSFQSPQLITLLRYVESFASNAENIRNQAIQNGSLIAMRATYEQMAQQAGVIRQQLSIMSTPGVSLLTWQAAENSTVRLAGALGIVAPGVDPSVLPPNQALLLTIAAACDRAISQVDIFSAQLAPWGFSIPEIPRVQGITRDLRGDLLRMRQDCAVGMPDARLRDDFREVREALARLDRDWNRVARRLPPGSAIPSINGIGLEIEEVRRLAGL